MKFSIIFIFTINNLSSIMSEVKKKKNRLKIAKNIRQNIFILFLIIVYYIYISYNRLINLMTNNEGKKNHT